MMRLNRGECQGVIMSEVEQQTESVEETKPQVSVEELMAKVEALESTNARLLEESKKNKSAAQTLKQQQEQIEREKKEKEGDYKTLLEQTEAKQRQIEKSALTNLIKYEVSKFASDARDMDDIIALLPSQHLEIDRENMKVSGVDLAVKALRESKAHLFKVCESIGQETSRPVSTPPKEKTLDDLSLGESLGALSKLL